MSSDEAAAATGGTGDAATDAQDELISQFLAFTGSADVAKATSYLEMSGNNVETAVGLYMEHEQGGGGGLGGGNGAMMGGGGGGGGDAAAAAAAAGDMMMDEDGVRAPDATRTMRLMDDAGHHPMMMGGAGGMMPMMMMPPGVADPSSFAMMSAMMDEQLQQQQQPSAFAAPPAPRGPVDARRALDAAIAAQAQGRDVTDYIQQGGNENINDENNSGDGDEYVYDVDDDDDDDDDNARGGSGGSSNRPAEPASLTDMFAAPIHLMHRAGGFQGARTMAKDTKRWLLVNIQRDSEFSSHALNRDVWRDELVENLVREGFIFWQQQDTHPEGQTYTERYQVQDYPHLGIIDPRTARLLWRKEGWTQENPMTAETFAEIAMDFCSKNSFDRPPQAPRPMGGGGPLPDAAAAPVRKRSVNEMSESEQLQAAMQASMEDVTASAVTDDADVETMEQDDSKPEAQPAAAAPEEESSPKPPSIIGELLSFPVPDEAPDGFRIQLRMPDGKKAVRKFGASDLVRTIYAYVAQNIEEARGGREFILMAGYPPNDLINSIEETIEATKLKGEAITVRWK